ncbi:hypothetical protein ACFFX1_55405 [Dactylosporangium sucinum]|uniref:Uncharacterized protein n=1 Tax=Dactylosporangium sucinum TaxID=1424081 RepID=A0A917U274_9ACTN|nr:hypothetical protein [Dactylosporangium sucinum]GGM52672.1 hypothetical protein GCM10007977_062830 [Dactylosporangium sucinum]
MTADEFDRLLAYYEDACSALYVEQTASAQERWEELHEQIQAEVARLRVKAGEAS